MGLLCSSFPIGLRCTGGEPQRLVGARAGPWQRLLDRAVPWLPVLSAHQKGLSGWQDSGLDCEPMNSEEPVPGWCCVVFVFHACAHLCQRLGTDDTAPMETKNKDPGEGTLPWP